MILYKKPGDQIASKKANWKLGNWWQTRNTPFLDTPPSVSEICSRSYVRIERSSSFIFTLFALRSYLWWFTSSSSVALPENSMISAPTWYLGYRWNGEGMRWKGWCFWFFFFFSGGGSQRVLKIDWVWRNTWFEIDWNLLKPLETINHQVFFHANKVWTDVFQTLSLWSRDLLMWHCSGDLSAWIMGRNGSGHEIFP